ncbi:DUF1772 domain-containing protein [Paenibacillus donghaensis]|nr:anthrone oxygenase family protein [Paenibacillus donghaensis]
MAGLFFAFSVFVMTALDRLPPPQGMAAMNSINAAILNPVFGLVFAGTAVASVILAFGSIVSWDADGAGYLLAGSLLYLTGSFLITLTVHVPLNNRLAAAASSAGHEAWKPYLARWLPWNHVRTVATLAAAACFIMAFRQVGSS